MNIRNIERFINSVYNGHSFIEKVCHAINYMSHEELSFLDELTLRKLGGTLNYYNKKEESFKVFTVIWYKSKRLSDFIRVYNMYHGQKS